VKPNAPATQHTQQNIMGNPSLAQNNQPPFN